MSDEYEGWTNRETWAVHLWLANEEPLWRLARQGWEARRIVEWLTSEDVGLAGDLIACSMARVDWAAVDAALQETTRVQISTDDAAEMLNIDPSTLRRQARAGLIRGTKVNGGWVFTKGAIAEYQRRHLGRQHRFRKGGSK